MGAGGEVQRYLRHARGRGGPTPRPRGHFNRGWLQREVRGRVGEEEQEEEEGEDEEQEVQKEVRSRSKRRRMRRRWKNRRR